jgi:hypothetical protein
MSCPTITAFGSDKWAHHRAAVEKLCGMRGQ